MKVDPFVRAFFAVIPHAYENTGSTLFNYQGVIIKYWKNQSPALKIWNKFIECSDGEYRSPMEQSYERYGRRY